MKPVCSDLIDAFLVNLDKGLIHGKDNSSGPIMLERLAAALQAIKRGERPDVALEIERPRGQPSSKRNALLAFKIHEMRKSGDTWASVENVINAYLCEINARPLHESRLRQIYGAHKESLEQFDSIRRMQNLTENTSAG